MPTRNAPVPNRTSANSRGSNRPTSSTISRYVEGKGVVNVKRYKETRKQVTTIEEEEESNRSSVLIRLVQTGNHFSAIDRELKFSFEESHCSRWPRCGQTIHCGCLGRNRHSLRGLISSLQDLVSLGQADILQLVRYTRAVAKSRYGLLPQAHALSKFARIGGGYQYLVELLQDLEDGHSFQQANS